MDGLGPALGIRRHGARAVARETRECLASALVGGFPVGGPVARAVVGRGDGGFESGVADGQDTGDGSGGDCDGLGLGV